jgi:MFS family permease
MGDTSPATKETKGAMTTSATSPLQGKRFLVVLFLFSQLVINYFDRVNLSVAAPVLAKHFHWDAATMGWVFSAYLWTYVACLIPSGMLLDRFGARKVCAVAVSLWSVATLCTGAVTNTATMILARLGLGVGEASTMPASNKTVRQWLPAGERARATTLYHTGQSIAMSLGPPVVAYAVVHLGWRWLFVVSGIPGFLWVLVWLKWFRLPEECSWLPQEERKLILETREGIGGPAVASDSAAPKLGMSSQLKPLLRQKSMFGMFLVHGCQNYSNYLFLAWLPMYLVHRGMTLMKAGIYTAIPNVFAVVMEVVFGMLSDRLLKPKDIKLGGRRVHNSVCFALMSLVLLIPVLENELAVIAIISIVLAGTQTIGAFDAALTNDLVQDPRVAGTALGILQFGGNIFGLAAPIVTGYIVKATGGFNSAFIPAGVLSLIGGVLVLTMTRQPIHGPLELQATSATTGRR